MEEKIKENVANNLSRGNLCYESREKLFVNNL